MCITIAVNIPLCAAMTPQEFITKWGPGGSAFDLNERQGAQPHFIDLCQMLGVPLPGSDVDYIFEQDTLVLGCTTRLAPKTLAIAALYRDAYGG